MTTEAPAPTLGDALLEKLRASPHPLTLKDAAKGVPKLKKEKPSELNERVRAALDAEVGTARLFKCLSGKNGEPRYWARDERHLLRSKAADLAAMPQPLSALVKAVVKEVKGADAGFVEGLVRDLIGEEVLFEHPGKKGAPLFGATRPPPPLPPLEQPANAKEFAKVVKAFEALMTKTGVASDAILAALGKRFAAPPVAEAAPEPETPALVSLGAEDVERHILDAVEAEGTMSLKELRRAMPEGGRGDAFDRAVLGLEERGRVSLSRDFDSSHFSPEEQGEYVREGDILFTSIAKRS